MVEYNDIELDGVFGALADPTRRTVLEHLRKGRATVSELADPFDISIQGVSKHLKKLEAAGLIRRTKEGREVWCEVVPAPLMQASSWLDDQRAFWEVRLDRLEEVLQTQKGKDPTKRFNTPNKEDTDGSSSD